AILALEADEVARAADQRSQLVVVEGLGEVVERSLAHGGDGGGDAAVRRDEDDRQTGSALVDGTHEGDAVHVGHLPVGHHHVGGALVPRPEGRGRPGLGLRLVAGPGERGRHHLRHPRLVVDDQDARAHAAARTGSLTVKQAPPPARSPTSMEPPCASTIWRTTASPSPVPRGRVVKNGSKIRLRISAGMPGPSPETASSTASGAARAATVTDPPAATAWPALESSPRRTWQTRSPSAVIEGSVAG